KACGEGLMPAGVRALRALGVEVPHARLRGVRNLDGGIAFEGLFPDGEPAWGVRRTALHAALVELAGREGVDLRVGVRATGLGDGGVATTRGPLRADHVVGADGLHSRIRAWAGIAARPGPVRRYGVRRHFRIAP